MPRRPNPPLLGLALSIVAGGCAANPPIATPMVVAVDLDAGSTFPSISDGSAPGPDVAPDAPTAAGPGADKPGPPVAGVPPACMGADLDLEAIIASKVCDVRDSPELSGQDPPGPDDIDIDVAPPKTPVRSGSVVTLEMVYRNRGQTARTLDLLPGGEKRDPTVTKDGRGQRVDYVGGYCYGVQGPGARSTVRVVLLPGGVLRVRVRYAARTIRQLPDCRESATPMKPGRYTVSVITPLRHPRVEPGAERAKYREARTAITVYR